MERNVIKEGICETNVCNLVTKSCIGQTSVEFVSAIEKKKRDKCGHFSIRAYVAEIRRKDWKISWPFFSLGDNEEYNKQADVLPPLHVPEYRLWSCQNCTRKSDASDDAAVIRVASNLSEDKIYEAREAGVNTSVDVISSECCSMIHDHMKEKVAIGMSNIKQDVLTSNNNNNTVVRDVDKTIKEPIFCQMKDAQCVNGEVTKDKETINLNLECSGLVEVGEANCGTRAVDGFMLNCTNKSSTEVLQKEKLVFRVSEVAKASEQQVEEMMCHQKPDLGTLKKEVVDSIISCHASKLLPLESTDNDEENDVLNLHNQLHADQRGDSSQNLSSKKPQKFRLLTEIIRGEVSGGSTKISNSSGTTNSDNVNTKFTQTKAADEPHGLGLNTHSIGWVAVRENVEKDMRGKNKKRKTLQAEDQVIKHDAECNKVGDVVSPFISAMDAFSGIGVNLCVFSNKATHRKAVVSELQTNMEIVEGDSAATYEDINFRSTETDIVPAKTAQKVISARGLHTSPNCCLTPEKWDTKSTLRNNKSEVPQFESGKTSVLSHHEVMPKEDQVMSEEIKIKHAETTGIYVRYGANASSGRGAHSGLKSKRATLRKATMGIKQNSTSQVQYGASLVRPKDIHFACNYENMDVQGHSETIRNQINERTNKMDELEPLNDIPIEIVELLAKNRHERRLLEAEDAKRNKFCMAGTTNNVKDAENFEFSGVHENEMSKYLWEKNLEMHKPQSSNARGGLSATSRSVAVEPKKGVGSDIKQLEESHGTNGSFAYSVSAVNHSIGNQFSGSGTGKNLGVQSCRWDGDKLGHGWPISSLQCSTSHPKNQIVSCPTQIRGAHHVSLPNVANGPFGTESSQKFATFSQRQNRNFHSKIHAEQPCACTQKKIGNIPKSVGPSDLYTNEIIPATQLLKLMDAGMSSRVSHTVDENVEFPNQPPFPQTDNCKEFLPLNGGMIKGPSKQLRSICFSKDYRVGKSGEHFLSVPISDAVVFPVQRDKNCARSSRIMGQVSQKMVSDAGKYRRRAKRKSSYSPMQAADSKLHGSVSGSGGLGKTHEFFPINGLQAGFHSASNSMILPSKTNLIENSIGNVEVDKKAGTLGPMKGSCGTKICSVNRNPADFSIPEAGNEFMIGGGDLKHRKMNSKRGRPRLRMMKLQALKDPAQTSIF